MQANASTVPSHQAEHPTHLIHPGDVVLHLWSTEIVLQLGGQCRGGRFAQSTRCILGGALHRGRGCGRGPRDFGHARGW